MNEGAPGTHRGRARASTAGLLADPVRSGVRLWRVPEVPPELAERWCREASGWFGADRAPVPGAEDHEHLSLLETPLGQLVAKAHRPRGWKRSLSRLGARPPRALHALRAACDLRAAGLPTPAPLAALRVRGGVLDVLITRRVEARDPWGAVHEGVALADVLEALASSLAELHGAGFRHRDLKATNILVRLEPEPRITWIDLDGLARPDPPRGALRMRDLARLCASFESAAARSAGVRANHWAAFLERYLHHASERELPPLAHPLVLARTRNWARRHVERNLARRRPVV